MEAVESLSVGGGLSYFDGSLDELQARAGVADGQFALVLNAEPEAGVYERITSAWVKNAEIPALFIESLAAIQALAAQDAAEAAEVGAEAAKAIAELAAMAAGSKIYASAPEGLAATAVDGVYIVQAGSDTLVYQNVAAAAVLIGPMFDKSELLQAVNNLSDLPDPAVARANLGAASQADVDAKLPKTGGNMTGDIAMDPGAQFVGSASDSEVVPSFTWGGQQALMGMYAVSAGIIGFAVAGAQAAVITAGGASAPFVTTVMTREKGDARYAQGAGASAWVSFNGKGTPTIFDAFNVASIVDVGLGRWEIIFTTPMANVNYSLSILCANALSGGDTRTWIAEITSKLTTGVSFFNQHANSSLQDADDISVIVFGGV
jgi:hypothetical protein